MNILKTDFRFWWFVDKNTHTHTYISPVVKNNKLGKINIRFQNHINFLLIYKINIYIYIKLMNIKMAHLVPNDNWKRKLTYMVRDSKLWKDIKWKEKISLSSSFHLFKGPTVKFYVYSSKTLIIQDGEHVYTWNLKKKKTLICFV